MAIRKKKRVNSETDVPFLNQLIGTLEQAELKLEEAYKKKNPNQVKYVKEFILKIQEKISEELR